MQGSTESRPAGVLNDRLDGGRAAEAALGILDLIGRSRDEARPVYDSILQHCVDLFSVTTAAVVLARQGDGHQKLAAAFAVDAATTAAFERGQVALDPASSLSARAILTGRVVHVAEALAPDAQPFAPPKMPEPAPRAELHVPLITATGSIGCLVLMRSGGRAFGSVEISLAEIFASLAVMAAENARHARELQNGLEREAATRQILQVIAQSRADEGPVFSTVLDSAARLCEAPYARLYLVDEAQTEAVSVASLGARSEYLERAMSRWPLDNTTLVPQSIISGKVIHIHDLADTDAYRAGDRRRRDAVDIEGIRTFLAVPLMQGNRAIGAIGIYRREVKPFGETHIALVETFAAQAVIAIENVRQLRAIHLANRELQDRLERERASADILAAISRSRDAEKPVFDAILGHALRLCGAETAALFLGRDAGPELALAAWHDRDPATPPRGDARPGPPPGAARPVDAAARFSAAVVRGGRLQLLPDILQSDAYLSGDPYALHLADTLGMRSALFVPLQGAQGVMGVVHLYRAQPLPFGPDDVALVETFAAQAVIAIENVRQFKALEALNAELGDRVQVQVGEIERMERLKRFLPAAVADKVISSGSEQMLSSHRALLGVLFCDIRGFTAFCETAEPEETIEVLQNYHEEMGRLIEAHGAGVDHRMGDGIMVLFNDPIPCDDPAGAAVGLGIAMRDRMAELCRGWKKMGYRLGFGVGVSLGYATVGIVGAGGRYDYTASGTAINLASRLSDEAQDGEILLSPRARIAVEDRFAVEFRGEIELKGIREPVEVFRLTGQVTA